MTRHSHFAPAARLLVVAGAVIALTSGPARADIEQAQIAPNDPSLRYTFPEITSDLVQPVFVTHAGNSNLYIVEQAGRIRVLEQGTVRSQAFLDIRNSASVPSASRLVKCCGEEGLLGLAFEPDYANTGRFYVYYTNLQGNQVIARYQRAANNPLVADPASGTILLTIPHPNNTNHNGGWIGFGPDNLLYAAVGDGGGGGDPFCAAENPNDLRGKMLRLDVVGKTAYTTPASNIFMDSPSQQRPEVFAGGLRNPWRASFDRRNGDLWIADVGQSQREEVNRSPAGAAAGASYQWSRIEGLFNFNSGCTDRFPASLPKVGPVAEYNRGVGQSITGGYVYRGASAPMIDGVYFFADYLSTRMWGTYRASPNAPYSTVVIDDSLGFSVSSFGETHTGELLLVDYGGSIRSLRVQNLNLSRRAMLPLVTR
jgi:Glucose / Sorbosone dehydrogenase